MKIVYKILCLTLIFSSLYGLQVSDVTYNYQFPIPQNTYHKYCKNVYSQNGEDGILEQLLKELKISQGTFCEFGAANCINSSNTFNLIKNSNFSGVAIEINGDRYAECIKNYKDFPQVTIFHGGVFYNDPDFNLNAWLRKGNLPYDFDILSIDIDCDDYYVWETLTDFNPKIVILETNSYRDPVFDELPRVPSREYNIDLLQSWRPQLIAQGCSFISAIKLGLQKGYIPLSFTGNITFIRKDLVTQLKEFPYKISDNPYDYLLLYTPLALWGNEWKTNSCLILNTAVRDYYILFGQKYIDIAWLQQRMAQIAQGDVIFS